MGLPLLRPMPLLLIGSNQSYYVLLLLGEFARLAGGVGVLSLVDLFGDVAEGGGVDLLIGISFLAIELYFCQICFKA